MAGGDLRGCALAELATGGLLAVIVWLDRTDPERPIYHPDTEGLTPVRNPVWRSDDGGATWASLGDLDSGIPQAASQGLLTLPDGTVLSTFETFKAYDEPGRWVYRGGLVRTTDEGRTWGDAVISAVMSDAGTMWWDPRIARLADGRLLQLYYAYEHDRGGEAPVHIGWSGDDGRTWTPPVPTTLTGQASYPIAFPGGELLAFTQRRDGAGSMVAAAEPGRWSDVGCPGARVPPRVAVRARGRTRPGAHRLPGVDGPLHLRAPVRRRPRRATGTPGLVRRRRGTDRHPRRRRGAGARRRDMIGTPRLRYSEHIWVDEADHLRVEEADAVELARRFGTPLFVVSEAQIRANVARYQAAFRRGYPDTEIYFSTKANFNPAVRRVFTLAGAGGDAFGLGELTINLMTGTPPEMIVLNGSNKQEPEIRLAVEHGVAVHVDHPEELETVARIAGELGRVARVAPRTRLMLHELDLMEADLPAGAKVGPGARVGNKFGMHWEDTLAVCRRAVDDPRLRLVGLHHHVGRWNHDPAIFAAVVREQVASRRGCGTSSAGGPRSTWTSGAASRRRARRAWAPSATTATRRPSRPMRTCSRACCARSWIDTACRIRA